MPNLLRSARARWAVPAVGAAVVAAGIGLVPLVADASPSLPDRSAAELLASTRGAIDHPFSGTVVQTARLGLPDLPDSVAGQGDAASFASLVTGSHTARIWYAGPDRTRISLVGDLAETDVIHSGNNVWTWTSSSNTAQHLILPSDAGAADRVPDPGRATMTPQQAAEKALAAIDPTTKVTVDGTASIAGRRAYELVLEPRDTRSLVGQVRIALDSKTSTPLRVEVFAKNGTKPAFESAFSSVTFATPSADLFGFTPPPGAKVTEQRLPSPAQAQGMKPDVARAEPNVIGKGWTSVLSLDGVDASSMAGNAQLQTLLRSAKPVSTSEGPGRVLRTALVSVLLLDNGRLLVGAVTPEVLEQAASAPAPSPATGSPSGPTPTATMTGTPVR